MKKLSWETITVEQFQAVYIASKDPKLDEMGKLENLISVLCKIPIAEVNELTMTEFKDLSRYCSFALDIEIIPGKPVRTLKANGRKYGINYKVTEMKHRQFIETTHFGEKPIENMHLIMASIVQPINRWGRWLKNEASMHELISSDLLQARLIDVYHSCVFFCKLYLNLINNIMPSLIAEMTDKGMTDQQAREVLEVSQGILAGCITQEKWQPLKV